MTISRFLNQPLTSDTTSPEIRHWASILLPLLDRIPENEIPPELLRRLNGHLPSSAEWLVQAIAETLAQKPALFPEVPTTPGSLSEAQARASAWLILRDAARLIAERADRGFRLEQAQAVGDSMGVLRHVRLDAQRTFAGQAEDDRLRAMEPAEIALLAAQDR